MAYTVNNTETPTHYRLTLPKEMFPIVDYSKDIEGEFTGDMVETLNNNTICINQSLHKTMYPIYNASYCNSLFFQTFIGVSYSNLKIDFIAFSENDEIIITLKK